MVPCSERWQLEVREMAYKQFVNPKWLGSLKAGCRLAGPLLKLEQRSYRKTTWVCSKWMALNGSHGVRIFSKLEWKEADFHLKRLQYKQLLREVVVSLHS